MILTRQPTNVNVVLSPKDYFLEKNDHETDFYGEYRLIHRIDMSYSGKEDQGGATFMYLTEDEAKVFREAGFNELV